MQKKKLHRLCLISAAIFFVVFSLQIVNAEELPYLKNVEVIANISMNSGLYTYKYTITNSSSSVGNLVGFDIELSRSNDSVILSAEGLTIPHGKTIFTFEQEMVRKGNLMKVDIVPVGIEKPDGWIAGIGISGFVGWGGGDFVQLKPGQSLSGFNFYSYGLPGIRNFKVDPALDFDADYYPGWDSVKDATDKAAAIRIKVQELTDKVSFKGKTIGPTAPPVDFKPIEFLDYIISLKKEAYNLGWIIQGKDKDRDEKDKKDKKDNKHEDKEHGIMKSLDKKLDEAREKLVKGDSREAIEKLWSFIHEIEALYKECEKGKRDKDKKEKEGCYHPEHNHSHITSEAYALLKYNTHYLIEQLKGEKK